MKKKGLSNVVYCDLKKKILSEKLLPGVRVSEKELAEKFGMSRTPVREALVKLSEQGLIQPHTGRGFIVRKFSLKEIEDLYTLREGLEVLAIRLAIPRIGAQKILRLKTLIDASPALIEEYDLAQFNQIDSQFHESIIAYSENEPLIKTCSTLLMQIKLIRRYDHVSPKSIMETYNQHLEILNFIMDRDITNACQTISNHILNSLETIRKAMLKV